MNRTTLALALSLVLVSACKKKEEAATAAPTAGAPAASAPTAGKSAEPAPAAAAPVKTNPKDLFAEFTNPAVDGLVLYEKYKPGATFTGTVKSVGEEQTGKPVIMVDVDGKNMISVDFTDPAVAKAKHLKAGDSLTVTCKIGGASGALMMVIECTSP